MAGAVKVGPWGASDGSPFDINSQSKPQRLESITIYSGEYFRGCIYGFTFVYVDQRGKPIKNDTWGRTNGTVHIIKMGPGEHLNHVSGTADDSGITSLKLETNHTKYKHYGYPQAGVAFSLPLQPGKGEVVAFFGRSDETLKALGVYVQGKKGSPVKVGKWGGSSGAPRDINHTAEPSKLESFTVYSSQSNGGRIYGFSFTYVTKRGQSMSVPLMGKANGHKQTFSMNQGEYVNNITGTYDSYGVTCLNFDTNEGASHTFGCYSGTTFSVPLPDSTTDDNDDDNGAAVAFFGSSGDSLIAIGAYVGVGPK